MARRRREDTGAGVAIGGTADVVIGRAGAPGEPGPEPLAEEIDFYSRHVGEWGADEGRHVLIRGREKCGSFATRDEALLEGLRRFGRVPFLVKQVIRDERPRPLRAVIL